MNPEPSICHLPISASRRLPLSLSHPFKVPESFCLSVPSLTSSPGQAISPNCQASHLLEPQHLSRVVKVRQASQKTLSSSLDVKPHPLPPRHSQTANVVRNFNLRLPVRHSFSEGGCDSVTLRLKNPNSVRESQDRTKDRPPQVLAPQSLLNLVQVSKSFSFYSPENLPVKPCAATQPPVSPRNWGCGGAV